MIYNIKDCKSKQKRKQEHTKKMCRHVPIDAVEQEEEEEEEEYDHENNGTIRGKWQMDGAETLDEAIVLLQDLIAYIQTLQQEGWELVDPIGDDYGHIRRTVPPQRDPVPVPVAAVVAE